MTDKIIAFDKNGLEVTPHIKNIIHYIESPAHSIPKLQHFSLKSKFPEYKEDLTEIESYRNLHKCCAEKDIRLHVTFDRFSAALSSDKDEKSIFANVENRGYPTFITFEIDENRPYHGSTQANCFI